MALREGDQWLVRQAGQQCKLSDKDRVYSVSRFSGLGRGLIKGLLHQWHLLNIPPPSLIDLK